MFVSVIIPTWRRAGQLRATLDSLAEQWPSGSGTGCEVIVVSDGEDAATRELASGYSAIPVEWIFHERNLGLPSARNSGAANAHGEILLFLDDDMTAAPGLLDCHAEAHEREARRCGKGKAVAVCGRIVESPQGEQRSRTGQWLERAWKETLDRFEAGLREDDGERIPPEAEKMSCFGVNCSISRELFHAAGGFHPALRDMDEEMEFGCRLYRRGVRLISEPQAIVYHRNEKDLVEYYKRCWSLGGSDDVLRAIQLGEHNGQTRQLLSMDLGPSLSRMTHRAFWHANGVACGLSSMLQQLTEWTGWRASFRLWQEITRQQHYWKAVREAGVGRSQLRELAGNGSRILMLHSIARPQNMAEASYYLSPARFRRLLETMKREGYACADPRKLEYPGARWGEREYVLTFDDGYEDFYTEVFPLIESYGLKPLVLLPMERIGDSNRWDQGVGLRARRLMNADQICELRRHGVRFGSHTLTHAFLPKIGDEQLRRELVESKHKLQDLLGEEVTAFAYPFGAANRRVRTAVIEAGYKVAFSTVEGLNVWQDPYSLMRTDFSDLVPPSFYSWKLRHGMGPRRSLKEEAMPLFRLMPRRVKRPIEAAWKQWRAAQG